jgi:endonuclease I
MKRLLIFAFIVASPFLLFAQAPEGYYNSSNGLSGESLKSALYETIKGHTEFPYSSSSTDTWDILKESDRDPDSTENVILFYTGWSVNAAQEYNNENGWNREHVWAKSRGDFGTSPGPGTDTHHLRPSDISVNFARNNRWFDTCVTPYVDGGQVTGCFTSVSRWVWQPRKEVKGDVARMIFYMATRYEGENGEPDLQVIDYLPADDFTKEPVHAKLSTLLEWHREDSVDAFEEQRNEVIYGYQGNRNPYIDHPEFVDKIWGTDPGVRIGNDSPGNFRVYPNPIGDKLSIEFEKTGEYTLDIRSIHGRLISRESFHGSSFQADLSGLPEGIYLLQIRSADLRETRKIIKQ